eukprot:TRINITY_DN33841_c0_g1_i1.p1 TRINITY_DN33841_c0_g1~~TRINITY_DN33841_c0_g1_i1.p1  ORF type:complete len:316 (-),score=38.92 TRINITY_DN33841_c0_g1_i1:84-1031(-)
MMERNLRRSAACLVAWTLLFWVISLPLCLYSYANASVVIMWYCAAFLLLVGGQLFVSCLLLPKSLPRGMAILQLAAVVCLTVAGVLMYDFMRGTLWFYAVGKASDGCSVQDISVLAERGKAILRCKDGYIPPPKEGVTLFKAQQEHAFLVADAPGAQEHEKAHPRTMYVLVAPLYSSIATSNGLPVALAVSYDYHSFADTIAPSAKSKCGSEAETGFCGYTLNYIDVDLAYYNSDMQTAVASALGKDSPWKDLPIVAPSNVTLDMSQHGLGFWLGLLCLVLGSPICFPLCCLLAVRPDKDYSSTEDEEDSDEESY